MTDDELKKAGGMIAEEGEVAPPVAPEASPEEEPAEGQDNAVMEAPPVEEESDHGDAGDEQPVVQQARPSRADKRITTLKGKLKSEEANSNFLKAEVDRLKGLLPGDQSNQAPIGQPAPVQQAPVSHEDAWGRLKDEQLQAIVSGDDVEITPAHRAKAMTLLQERTADRIVSQRLAPHLMQQRQAKYTNEAMSAYPELFVDGSIENQLLRQVYASDTRLGQVEDGILIAAERTMARVARARMPALVQANSDAQRKLRKAKAGAELGSGSPAPIGGTGQRASMSDMSKEITKRGYDWKKSDKLLNKVNDLL